MKTIAVFFGGRSTEHDISIITALSSVIKPLEASKKFNIVPVYISKDGKWYSDNKLKNVSIFLGEGIDAFCEKNKPVAVVFDGGMILRKTGIKNKDTRIDIAFPAMHGTYGEDGSLMGLLRMAGIPFVGLDQTSSVIAMDKVLSKQIVGINNIPTSKYIYFSRFEYESDSAIILKKAVDKLSFPLFIKPAHLGSSIGITKVKNVDELQNAMEVAMYYDDRAVIEEAVSNLIEVTVPIMGNDILKTALVEKALTKNCDFFDFDTKYINGGGNKKCKKGSQGYSELPAKLPLGMYEDAIETAKKVYIALGCEGISRIDLLIDSVKKIIYFNEINPLPGDLYTHNWRASGVSSVDLVCGLVDLAEERYARDQKTHTTFSSSYLKQPFFVDSKK